MSSLKVRFIATLVCAGVVGAAGFYFLNPGVGGSNGDEVIATLTVRFSAGRRLPVGVTAFVNRDKMISETTLDSPWVDSVTATHGSLITLASVQGEAGSMSCSITIRDVTTGPVHADPVNGGICKVMATA